MFTITASLKIGKIISVVDNGPQPGDVEWIKPAAKIIAKQIVKEATS